MKLVLYLKAQHLELLQGLLVVNLLEQERALRLISPRILGLRLFVKLLRLVLKQTSILISLLRQGKNVVTDYGFNLITMVQVVFQVRNLPKQM